MYTLREQFQLKSKDNLYYYTQLVKHHQPIHISVIKSELVGAEERVEDAWLSHVVRATGERCNIDAIGLKQIWNAAVTLQYYDINDLWMEFVW